MSFPPHCRISDPRLTDFGVEVELQEVNIACWLNEISIEKISDFSHVTWFSHMT